ncbi:hypothetical protein N802_04290 [Knoellia sinensis KCTC 19936]|uniref:Lipase n=1 Tax=Knoellia sinensis KCTC 19936 TaxID=1385520 RepID=A0A0A0J3N7_9MICO|nr:lipase family protein [Knoellia sinensis]KGN31314.1 hypothetical protein N802_04290 [Knoellia sinensis KCTC 19936]
MRPSRAAAIVAAAVLACPAAVLATAPAVAVESKGVEMPAFYDPPTSIPSTPGTVIRTEPMPTALNLPVVFPGTSTRLMYSTTDSNGLPAPATGALIRSTKSWGGPGPRPVVAFAFGTIGQGDQCAPSYGLEHPLLIGIGSDGGTFNANYEVVQMSGLLAKGYDVALSDYIGLGSTDRLHTYMNRADQAHALLDVVRAVRNLPDSPIVAGTKVGLWGYSQGGGAVAAAAELQPTYAPDVNLVGAYAGAPPANLHEVIKGVEKNAIAAVLGYTLNGLIQSYPELRPVVDARMNDKGFAALRDISTQCIPDSAATYGFSSSTEWTKDGKSLTEIIAELPHVRDIVDEQQIGTRKPTAPVLVTTKLSDGTVPHKQARQLAVDWCGKGARVTYVPLGLPALPGDTDRGTLHHIAGVPEGLPTASIWMQKRFEGASSVNSCPIIRALP